MVTFNRRKIEEEHGTTFEWSMNGTYYELRVAAEAIRQALGRATTYVNGSHEARWSNNYSRCVIYIQKHNGYRDGDREACEEWLVKLSKVVREAVEQNALALGVFGADLSRLAQAHKDLADKVDALTERLEAAEQHTHGSREFAGVAS